MDDSLDNIVGENEDQNEKKNYSWEKEGKIILDSKKKYLTDKDIITINYLFQNPLPDNLREEFWLLVTGAKQLKLNNPNYYNTLLNKYPENPISMKNESQILLDIHRTFPEDDNFKEEKINSLKNILIAYSRRNCTLGYCQGFNYIVGKLLKVINNEENVFWIFTQIIENILPINYYYDSAGIIIDNKILFERLKIIDKELMDHFEKYHFNLLIQNFLYKWLICLFSQNIKDELLFLIWDIFFLEGTPVLFKTIIIILEKNKDKLLEIKQIDKLVNFFNTFNNLSLLNQHKDELLKDLLKYDSINDGLVKEGRKKFYKEVKESIKGLNKFKSNLIKKCCENWDNCSYIKRKFDGDDFVVYQNSEKMEIIEDFFLKKIKRCNSLIVKGSKNIFQKKMNKFYEYDNLMVQRRIHECPNGIRKRIRERMKSFDELYKNKNMIKDMLEGVYKFNEDKKKNNKKNKSKSKNKKMDDINKNENDENFENFLLNLSINYD